MAANENEAGIAPDEVEGYRDYRRRVAGTNIDERSLLATDYLNHLNEIVMLVDLIPDAPEFLDDARAWAPKSYAEHFNDSGFSAKELAIAAYEHAPRKFRLPFDNAVDRANALVATGLERIAEAVAADDTERLRHVCAEASRALQGVIDEASAIIHGDHDALAQVEIDALVDIPRGTDGVP